MSKSCWDCLHFIVDSAYDEGGRCGELCSYDCMGDEHCPSFEPLPKGACCARCRMCDWQHGRCVKHDRPVYTPDAMPCRNYDPNREDEAQVDGTLLPGLEPQKMKKSLFTLCGKLVQMGGQRPRVRVQLAANCTIRILCSKGLVTILPMSLLYSMVEVQYELDSKGMPRLFSIKAKEEGGEK